MKKNIVVVGYPKSGTTWLTRLVADLVGCPIVGHWGFSNNVPQSIIEGTDRISEFSCYKSHREYHDLFSVWEKKIYKIIYVVRDPRDIVISGAHFFKFSFPGLRRILKRLPGGNRIYYYFEKICNLMMTIQYKQKRMNKTVLYGDISVTEWCKSSWKKHYQPYLNDKKVFFVKYEDVLNDPSFFCKELLDFLDLKRTQDEIINSIDNQSFNYRKQEFIDKGDSFQIKLLRKGESGSWQQELPVRDKNVFKEKLGQELRELGYGL